MNEPRLDLLYIVNGNGLSTGQGGSIVRTFEVAKRVRRAGLKVGLLATSGSIRAGLDRGFEADLTVPTPVFPFGPRTESGLGNRALNYLWTSASGALAGRHIRAAVTVTDSDYPCDVLPAIAHSRGVGSRWVASVHHRLESSPGSPLHNASILWQRLAMRLIARFSARALVYDSPMGDAIAIELRNFGLLESRICRMTNGVDFAAIESADPAEATWDGLFVGGIRPDKGLEDLAPIWAEVVKSRPSARLAVVGGSAPGYERAFDESCRLHGLSDQVVRLGNLPPAEVYALMKSTGCVISATRTEGWGTATCEALAAGARVVAYDLPTTRYIFGPAIDLIPCFDHPAFAKKVLSLLADQDAGPDRSQRLRLAQKFDWDEVARRDIEILDAVLAD